MTSNKVLYLSFDGLTDPLGQSQILPYLFGLSKSYSITIISLEKPDRFLTRRESIESVCKLHSIFWVPLVYHKRPPVFCTLFDLLVLFLRAKKLQKLNSFKIVHCRSYITSIVGQWMKRKYGVKFIFDMRGFWADERVEGKIWKIENLLYKMIYKFFKKKEQEFLKQADAIISLTENAKSEILGWGFVNSQIHVIPCCVDVEHFNPAKFSDSNRNDLRKKLGFNPSDFVLLYLGSLGTWYLMDKMIILFNELKKKFPSAKFLFITPDIDKVPVNSDFVAVSLTRNQVPSYVCIADCAVCFIMPSFSKKASSATKVAEALSMGIPIFVNSGWGDVDKPIPGLVVIDEEDFEKSFQTKNIEMYLEKIKASTSFKIRQSAELHYSLNTGIHSYLNVYEKLVNE